ncbi:hypothetical protein, conserved [Trypanosoma brucei brucei TREU927]|uniref:PSP1 C-terminal domain-containing protein n=1 Tax=Trypanosoma brucei brucei (strain 927/4 GUTat10.1) TaxID=185431 RepID=Q38AD1_TRYB2|nr:hypothetical protein, conserved [Trypanosoma brucei brucei TREU927]EAN78239.1 hypothetical protein, conserved [Trypanosoma brucei brucei TREU927]
MASLLADVTNVQASHNGKEHKAGVVLHTTRPSVIRHDPYGWKCLIQPTLPATAIAFPDIMFSSKNLNEPENLHDGDEAPASPATAPVCSALVQFKCHQKEFSSPILVGKGQYVVVEGDRGIDVGVVIRVNTDSCKTYVERSGPTGNILRYATQQEVDYWAIDLKEQEAIAVTYCQRRVHRHRFDMEIRHAEYQFDKKKLTFYYTAKARIDFVQLLKELYREFGCRIWMEKVRTYN